MEKDAEIKVLADDGKRVTVELPKPRSAGWGSFWARLDAALVKPQSPNKDLEPES